MIPAVLPPPRTDHAPGPASTGEDTRFDDAYRRAVDPQTNRHAEGVSDDRHGPTVDHDGVDGAEDRPCDTECDAEDHADPGHESAAAGTAVIPAPPASSSPHGAARSTETDGCAVGSVSPPPASPAADAVTGDGTGEVPAHRPDMDPAVGTAGDEHAADTVTAGDTSAEQVVTDQPVDAARAEPAAVRGETTEPAAGPGTGSDQSVDGTEVDAPRSADDSEVVPPAGRGPDAQHRPAPVAEPLSSPARVHGGGAVDASSVAPAAPVTVTTTSAPTPAAPPSGLHPPVAQQVVDHVTPLVDGPDGTHELTIELRPAELGRVQLEVTLDDGVLHVRVTADDPGSRRLLAHAIDDLRTLLGDAGITAGDLDVGDPRPGDGSEDGPDDERSGRRGTRPSANSTTPITRTRAPLDALAAVDVLL